jgi:hypothetical protein
MNKVEVIELDGEKWNLDDLAANPDYEMLEDAIEEYTLYDYDGNVVDHESVYRSAAAAALGKTKTAKKADASRENGKKGGRPKNYLGLCNVIGTDSWKRALSECGYDPADYRCVTWHTGKPDDYDFCFRVRAHDPLNYIVKK